MPFFSIIIPTCNRFTPVQNAIDSVLAQSFTDFELIVVDDGSIDETFRLEEIYRGKIRYLPQDNSGVSSARNRGIRESSSEYILFLDSDDLWMKEKLQAHRDYIEKKSEILIHQTNEIWIRKGKRVNPRSKHKKIEGDIFRESLELCLISPSAVCIHRKLLEEYGMFDEYMPACEDYDLWLRITSHEKTGLIDEYHVKKYGGHSDQLSSRFWGMDRFRIYSIIKLLERYREEITPEYQEAAFKTLIKKTELVMNGAMKRSNNRLAEILDRITHDLNRQVYNSKYARNLLTG
jgi:glycosyltransferase involved in cell wall biosynthesis